MRITATRLADGRTALALQQYNESTGWGEPLRPRFNVLPAVLKSERTLVSSEVQVTTSGPPPSPWTNQTAYISADVRRAAPFVSRVLPALASGEGRIVCVRVEGDADGVTTCEATAAAYQVPVEEVVVPQQSQLREYFVEVFDPDDLPTMVQVSSPSMLLAALEARAGVVGGVSMQVPVLSPILFHRRAFDHESLHCATGHGDGVGDAFWFVLGLNTIAAAERLGMNYDVQFFPDSAEQAAFIRDCIDRGAATISSSIADPDAIVPALQEAQDAGVRVVTYNSGNEHAQNAGSDLHVGLDDFGGGVEAGKRFKQDGVTGTVLCLIHEARNVGLQQRCDGLAEGYGGPVEVINLQEQAAVAAANPLEQPAAIGGVLAERLSAGGVGAILTLNTLTARIVFLTPPALRAGVAFASFGFDETFVVGLYSGDLSFAVFDHAFVQGYLSVAAQSLSHGLIDGHDLLLAGAELLITPSILDADAVRSVFANLFN